ncbi:ras-like GTP-binding protein RhoL isoform X3 [Procambarus clarkii]|uniref:ras-like GTP-binding protein RhoL isoform X3 n=1 Tax=Procambarus clarkii TaxID=6728 RepID=UPI001E676CC4|nr:ras-like GTP-binding protein RhoL isoform X1 [Procambarus clarkii]XP_045598698.1 ras-like GTP-binding protein RhoL isoform X1 [Procambarus clarkii]XP_045598699.1 ras-like GTP-binding protein RhoL isoform X1 [Procambarus clarkii]
MSQRPLKITVVGDGYVGKTSLLVSYTTGKFPEEYIPTVFDNYTGKHTLMQRTYPITLWDSAGQEDYELLRPLSYPGTNVFIVCFALDNHNSFENVTSKWLPELHQKCPKAPIVLVGTKLDVRNLSLLTPQDGKRLAKNARLSKYVECSAKTQEGVQEVINSAILAAVGSAPIHRMCVIV